MIAKARGNKTIRCFVFESEGPADEALHFRETNSSRVAVAAFYDFRAGLGHNDPECVQVRDAVESYGFNIQKRLDDNVIGAVNGLRSIRKRYGIECLELMLYVIRQAYDGTKDSLQEGFLKKLSMFLYSVRSNSEFNVNLFIEGLKKTSASRIMRDIKNKYHRKADKVAMEIFTEIHNGKRKNKNIL
jgi:hypothetical protein